ncbi:DEKNAAC102544 [Brettanomyces naardenensis]|uniref:Large ribosomal subunit protein uL11m n=1 Tax=Brettanomyces naardenensis TaxID=13370 RepID=A0A448YLB3_BRENA|nr:DEKNAAC102544 [Brettanomyces naardenensis]
MSALRDVPIKLVIGAGKAAPTPPVGPALGSKGVKAIDFCREFNARTAHYKADVPIPVRITVHPDRTFNFDIKAPSTSWLLLQASGKTKGSDSVGKGRFEKQGYLSELSLKHIYEIAKIKQTDAAHADMPLKDICKGVIGTARALGINVVP